MKGLLEIDNAITRKVDRYKIWAIPFCKYNTGVENKYPRMYV